MNTINPAPTAVNNPYPQANPPQPSQATIQGPSLSHFSAIAIGFKSPVIMRICKRLSDKIYVFYNSARRRAKKQGLSGGVSKDCVILLLQDGDVVECALHEIPPQSSEPKSLAFVCVDQAGAASHWAHDLGDKWAVKLSLKSGYPEEVIINLLCGWVTFGNYIEIYKGLDACALIELVNYYRGISRVPPHQELLAHALQSTVKTKITGSAPRARGR